MCYRYTTLDQVPDKTAAALGVALPRIARAVMKVKIRFLLETTFALHVCPTLSSLLTINISEISKNR